jgi:hypothetical protein
VTSRGSPDLRPVVRRSTTRRPRNDDPIRPRVVEYNQRWRRHRILVTESRRIGRPRNSIDLGRRGPHAPPGGPSVEHITHAGTPGSRKLPTITIRSGEVAGGTAPISGPRRLGEPVAARGDMIHERHDFGFRPDVVRKSEPGEARAFRRHAGVPG